MAADGADAGAPTGRRPGSFPSATTRRGALPPGCSAGIPNRTGIRIGVGQAGKALTTALEGAATGSCRTDEALCRPPPTEDDTEPQLPGDKARGVGGDPVVRQWRTRQVRGRQDHQEWYGFVTHGQVATRHVGNDLFPRNVLSDAAWECASHPDDVDDIRDQGADRGPQRPRTTRCNAVLDDTTVQQPVRVSTHSDVPAPDGGRSPAVHACHASTACICS